MEKDVIFLRVSKDNEVVEISSNLKSQSVKLIDFKSSSLSDVSNPTVEMFNEGVIYYNSPFLAFNYQKKLDFIAMPTCSKEDLYFYISKSQDLFISNDFFWLSRRIEKVELSAENISKVINKLTPNSGETIVKDIHRFRPYNTYKFVDGKIVSSNLRKPMAGNVNSTYTQFKDYLVATIKEEVASQNEVALLFSGGVDSTLVGLILTKIINVKTVPVFINVSPSNADFESDRLRAVKVANKLNWKLHQLDVDLKEASIDTISPLISKIPLTPHLGMAYYKGISYIKSLNINTVFCGQNLDTLYNLEATAQIKFDKGSLAALFRRYFYSKFFLKSLDDVKGKAFFSKRIARMIGWIGVKLYSKIKGSNYTLPSTSVEALENYKGSVDDVIFNKVESGDSKKISRCKTEQKSYKDVYHGLWMHKVQEYLMGGVNMVPHAVAKLNGVKSVLPYGSEFMVRFFENNSIEVLDVFKPKRFVYDFIEELEPGLLGEISKKTKSHLKRSTQDWFKEVHTNTRFGKSCENFDSAAVAPFLGSENLVTHAQRFNRTLGSFWVFQALKFLKNQTSQTESDEMARKDMHL